MDDKDIFPFNPLTNAVALQIVQDLFPFPPLSQDPQPALVPPQDYEDAMSVNAGPAGQTPWTAGDDLMDPTTKKKSIFRDPDLEPPSSYTDPYLVYVLSYDAQTPCLLTLPQSFRVFYPAIIQGQFRLSSRSNGCIFCFIIVHLDRKEIAFARLSARFYRIFQNRSIMGLRKY
jgi:hypothetical protein